MSVDHLDVLIVGGGLSGVCAAVNLQTTCPKKTYTILESRENIGGTWDLFRYPGVRSDSDMFTLGYSFRPWQGHSAIASGESILQYIRQTATDHGIDGKIRFNHRVVRASWSSVSAHWTVDVERGLDKELVRFTCGFLFVCGGYYSYAEGYTPEFPGSREFAGAIVHPQKWPKDLRYDGKRVVVIGSGATAVTLVPEIAKSAAMVTMLQRSPTYVVSAPHHDAVASFLRKALPASLSYKFIRWRNILFSLYVVKWCELAPGSARNWILKRIRAALGAGYDIATHFTPRYDPWKQRMCLVPDGDLFEAIKAGRATVVTDEIVRFTRTGIELRSGEQLDADIIVTATGLNVVVLGGIQLSVDGRAVDLSKSIIYKGSMYGGVPNLASIVGYTNASWTLKCELSCHFICRLLNHMDKTGYRMCVPQNTDSSLRERPGLNLSSGYIQRAADRLPKQGSRLPWRMYDNYVLDRWSLRNGAIDDGVIRFSHPYQR